MRAACGRVVPHRGFARFPIALSRAHNSCAQLIETAKPEADIFKNGRSDVAKDRPQCSLHKMHACRTRPLISYELAISYRVYIQRERENSVNILFRVKRIFLSRSVFHKFVPHIFLKGLFFLGRSVLLLLFQKFNST